MEKRFQVFVSSTFDDLKDERQSVLRAILMLDHMPAGMELFPATDDTAWQLICDVIDASDYYVLVLGGRYGSLDEEGIGYTEKEYRYASEKKIPVVSFLHSNPDNLPREKTETDSEAWEKLVSFREEIEKSHTCMYWSTPEELQTQVVLGLTATVKRNPAQGWVRAGSIASEEASLKIIELQNQVKDQQDEIDRISTSPPIGTENLAQGDDLLDIEFKVTFSPRSRYTSDGAFRDKITTQVTWDQIFGAISPNLTEPQRESKIKSDINRFLKESFEEEFEKAHPNHEAKSLSINETTLQIIRIQLTALGLIESEVRPVATARGDEKEYRFCELTSRGRTKLLKLGAIYKADSTAKDS